LRRRVDTALAQAQVNLVERLLDRRGSLPDPDELKSLARREQGVMTPTSQMRALRELEPPDADEGFAVVERVPFERAPREGRTGVLVGAAALRSPGWTSAIGQAAADAPHLLFDWQPDGSPDSLAEEAALLSDTVRGSVEVAVCPHRGGAPTCWCRPPLPGLALVFARAHDVDPARSVLVGTSTAHRTLAIALGSRYVPAT